VEFTFVLFKVAVGKTMFWDQGEEPEVVPEGFDSLCLEGEIPFPVCGGKMIMASWDLRRIFLLRSAGLP